MFTVTRSKNNPLLTPVKEHPWESAAAFNGCPVVSGKKKFLVYRALSEPDLLKSNHLRTSVIARAVSKDGVTYTDKQVLISPSESFDQFGCEDPRVTKFGPNYFIFYTALGGYPFSADNIRVAVALSKDLNTITTKHLVTPFNAKGMGLFPELINGKMAALLTVSTDAPPSSICYAEFETKEDIWSPDYWKAWQANLESHKLGVRRQATDHLELGAAPVKTDKGWLVIYCHIQHYGNDPVFGVEALLLDLKNPRKIIGRTKGPFMVAEAYYEQVGQVPNLIFPSGARIQGKMLEVYYGAADTYTAMATIPLDNFLESLLHPEEKAFKRFPGNPIIAPRPGMDFEAGGTLNPAAIDINNKVHILYRAVSKNNVSTVGLALSKDGLSVDERLDKPIYVPRAAFEKRGDSDSNYGCEDARIVKIGDKLYITYTGYNGSVPRVAVSSIKVKDFTDRHFEAWGLPEAITPENVDEKDAAILPEPIGGKYMVFHRAGTAICASFISSLDFTKERVNDCIEIIGPRRGMWDGGKIGLSAPPIKTDQGWLLFYHGVSWSTTYRVGAILLDLKDPTIVLARTAIPIFEPEEEYERKGIVPNVVFPCGVVLRGATIYMYYGGADSVVGVATMKLKTVLAILKT